MAAMRTGIHEALSLLAQAGAFFGRHYLVIALFSAPVRRCSASWRWAVEGYDSDRSHRWRRV